MSGAREPIILDFTRFELKYLVEVDQFGPLMRDLLHFTRLKLPEQDRDLDHYHVRSLYFDDPDFTCYHDKLAGVSDRRKMRIRTYSRTPEDKTPTFLEFKLKDNMTVRKARVALPEFHRSIAAQEMSVADVVSIAGLEVGREELINSFFAHRQVFSFEPKLIITYERVPLEDPFRPDFRICLDHDIKACATREMFPGSGWLDVLWRWFVIEIKFSQGVPKWFHYVIGKYDLYNWPVSKYCNSCEALDLAIHESKEPLDHGYYCPF